MCRGACRNRSANTRTGIPSYDETKRDFLTRLSRSILPPLLTDKQRASVLADQCSGRWPTAADIAEINLTHLIRTPLKPADLLFVFGTREDDMLRAEAACRLWRDGLFRHAIVSGGVTPGAARSECAIIKAAMVDGGIPPARILEEHRAMNTGENVIFSLPVIDAELGRSTIRSVICLGNSWTARRYPMTLQRHWPEVEKMLVTVDSFKTPLALWHTHPEFRRRVRSEWDKIEPYKAKGFIAEWPLPERSGL